MGWYDTDWLHRVELTLASAVADAQVMEDTNDDIIKLSTGAGTNDSDHIYFDGNCLNYFDDIRVTLANGTTLIPYALRNGTSSYAELILLPSDTGTKVWVYYGNSAATRASEPEEVFLTSQFMHSSVQVDAASATHGICRLANGTIFSVLQVGVGGGEAVHKLYFRKSTDGCRTWSARAEFFDPGATRECAQPMVAAIDIGGTEHIVVSFWQANAVVWDAGQVACIIVSIDEGVNWGSNAPNYDNGTEIEISPKGADSAGRFVHCRVISYVEDSTQKLAVATCNRYSNNSRIYFEWCATSDLTSWSEVEVSTEGAGSYEFSEPVLLEVKDNGSFNGDFYIICRCDVIAYNPRCIYSANYGVNWGNDHGGTPPYSNKLSDPSGLTMTAPDGIDIIRTSEGDMVLAYGYRSGANDGEIRLIKPTGEDMNDSGVEVTWTEGSNYANVWRTRVTIAWSLYGYPSLCEIADGGQFGVIIWMPDVTGELFYVGKNAFVSESFAYSATTELAWLFGSQTMGIIEATTDNTPAVMLWNPTETHYIVEWAIWTVDVGGQNDQEAILISNAARTAFATLFTQPLRTDQAGVYYYEDGAAQELGTDIWAFATKLIGRITIDESDYAGTPVDYDYFNSAWASLASEHNREYYTKDTNIDVGRWEIGSHSALAYAWAAWYWITVRKYTAGKVSAIGSEEEYVPPVGGGLSQAAMLLLR